MPSGRVVALEGGSAAGKTTVAAALARREGWTVVPEAFRRLAPAPSLEFDSPGALLALEERLLREEARRFAEARAAAASGVTVLADTGFLGPLTYTGGLIALGLADPAVLPPLVAAAGALGASGTWGLPDGIVWLDAREPVRGRRSGADPEGHPARLASRHAAVATFEHRLYARGIGPRYGARFAEVAADGAPGPVARATAAAVRRVVAARHRRPELAEVVALIAAAARPPARRGNR